MNPRFFLANFRSRARAWLLCSWRGHAFVRRLEVDGRIFNAPLICCERCGKYNPHIRIPGVNCSALCDVELIPANLPEARQVDNAADRVL